MAQEDNDEVDNVVESVDLTTTAWDTNHDLNRQVQDWLLRIFGSFEAAAEASKYLYLHYEPLECIFEENDHKQVIYRASERVTLKLRDIEDVRKLMSR